MRTGKSLQELAAEVERQAGAKRDFVSPDEALWLRPGTQSSTGRVSEPTLEMYRNGAHRRQPGSTPVHEFGLRDTFHFQLGQKLGIPQRYYDRMRTEDQSLLASNVNAWLSKSEDDRMVRTLDGGARAYLSDRYRPLDHIDLLPPALQVFSEARVEVKSCEVTERRLYVQVVTPRLEAEVKVGDVVQAGLVFKNSEVGWGAVSVATMLYRLICRNGMVRGTTLRQHHVGRRNVVDGAEEFYKDETRDADDKAFLLKFRDVVQGLLSEEVFERNVNELREATQRKITGSPEKALEEVQRKFRLTDHQRGDMLRHLIEGGDLSAWGVANAATAMAHDEENYDASVDLQRLGGRIIELPRKDWQMIATAQ